MPTPSTEQTYMSLWDGRAPAVDADGILRNLIWSPRFSAKVAAYTVTAKETGTHFTTVGATTAIVFTLPAIADGPWVFKFLNAADVDMTVTAGTADTMIGFNDVDLDSLAASTSSEKIGGIINVYCDGTKLFVSAETSDPRYQTFVAAD
jgi:hypothetical protein